MSWTTDSLILTVSELYTKKTNADDNHCKVKVIPTWRDARHPPPSRISVSGHLLEVERVLTAHPGQVGPRDELVAGRVGLLQEAQQ